MITELRQVLVCDGSAAREGGEDLARRGGAPPIDHASPRGSAAAQHKRLRRLATLVHRRVPPQRNERPRVRLQGASGQAGGPASDEPDTVSARRVSAAQEHHSAWPETRRIILECPVQPHVGRLQTPDELARRRAAYAQHPQRVVGVSESDARCIAATPVPHGVSRPRADRLWAASRGSS